MQIIQAAQVTVVGVGAGGRWTGAREVRVGGGQGEAGGRGGK